MKKKNKVHSKKIFARSLAMKLVEFGAELIDVQPNKVNKDYMMYVFVVNEKLDNAFKQYYNKKIS